MLREVSARTATTGRCSSGRAWEITGSNRISASSAAAINRTASMSRANRPFSASGRAYPQPASSASARNVVSASRLRPGPAWNRRLVAKTALLAPVVPIVPFMPIMPIMKTALPGQCAP